VAIHRGEGCNARASARARARARKGGGLRNGRGRMGRKWEGEGAVRCGVEQESGRRFSANMQDATTCSDRRGFDVRQLGVTRAISATARDVSQMHPARVFALLLSTLSDKLLARSCLSYSNHLRTTCAAQHDSMSGITKFMNMIAVRVDPLCGAS
jgi:hypothetical protein